MGSDGVRLGQVGAGRDHPDVVRSSRLPEGRTDGSPAALHAQRQAGNAPLVADVRTPEECASGHIPGAVNIPFDQVTERIAELQSPHGVALYCMQGPRARKGEAASRSNRSAQANIGWTARFGAARAKALLESASCESRPAR
ncbi:rhodanese-like domain-containing protein [Myxococcota bacterium]|nr:rhodanese-like domain-containing protein [Myxococcota bacterium]MCZ7617908.1 rhodanese-like domain-containing protein [Myxococcota bacterium]